MTCPLRVSTVTTPAGSAKLTSITYQTDAGWHGEVRHGEARPNLCGNAPYRLIWLGLRSIEGTAYMYA
jgi:hypothetical protein